LSYEQPPTPQLPIILPQERHLEPQPQRAGELVDAASVDRAHAELEAAGRIRERRRRRRIELFFDSERREVRVVGKTIVLTYGEFEIFRLLAGSPYWPFTFREVISGVAKFDCGVDEANLDAHIVSLRDKLGEFCDYIQSVPNFGYRFRE
jgi:DNA-binding response OmpR family regulator